MSCLENQLQPQCIVSAYIEADLTVKHTDKQEGQCVELKEPMKDQKQQTYWQETGRWVGCEESFDPQAGVWATSSISYLTFKSLIQLRRTMNTGVTIFDCEEQTFASIAEKMVNEMVNKKEIKPESKEGVLKSLLQNHRYSFNYLTVTQTQMTHMYDAVLKAAYEVQHLAQGKLTQHGAPVEIKPVIMSLTTKPQCLSA
ncbi:band 3 anion exchange protein-like [Notothenia coriiceps]|uniref:Band 3 anion exchange protein-like n=1 Tax=Notothenia coriiceps TaxID=8208 RepID=A0A6I9NWE7_9TELE|nr:PREDICTED: band 3 anion exchange protein-like [Notothenia coriiceps]